MAAPTRISGGDGADTIFGGDGDDTIYGHSVADLVANSGNITATLLANVGSGAVFVTGAPGDDGFVYAERKDVGDIVRINTTTGAQSVFLDIPADQFSGGGERGVLGLAFHPDYAANGRFFVFLTNPSGDIEVREYLRSAGDPALADPTPVRTIITIPHPTFANHNGGSLAFGPDGYLYIATGDGGGGNDPDGNAQNTAVLLGKILRLDVDGDDFPADASRNYAIPADNPFAGATAGADEIWAYGLRNPWRFSFDSLTGDLYIGDVGQAAREEVDFEAAGGPGGFNYGWDYREGTLQGPSAPPQPPIAFVEPVFDYRQAGRQLDNRRLRLPRPCRRAAGRLFLRRFRHRADFHAAHGERRGRGCDRAHRADRRRRPAADLVVRHRQFRQSLRRQPDRRDLSARSRCGGRRRRRPDRRRRRQ